MLKEKLTASCKLLFCLVFFCGCAVRSVYIPVSQNTPLFSKNKSVQVNAYGGANHLEVQAAHNPAQHLALAANINFGSGISIYDAAMGWYGTNASSKWRSEVFAGYGYNSNIAYQTANYNTVLQKPVSNFDIVSLYDKYYVQPGAGYFNEIKMYKLKYSFGLSVRFSALNFKSYIFREIDGDSTQKVGYTIYLKNTEYHNKTLYLIEPCFTNKVGLGNLYLILQGQFFIPYSKEIDVSYTKFSQGFLLSVGLQYNLKFKSWNAK